jgi:hypothetical protein
VRPMNKDGLSPELLALLACARTVLDRANVPALALALGECPSTDELCRVAVEQGMLGHLHRLVTAEAAVAGDPKLIQRLSELQRAAAARNLRSSALLVETLGRLEAGGVRVLPVKGPIWAELLYGDLGSRGWSDIDLLVGREQVELAREVLLGGGFRDCIPFSDRTVRAKWGNTGQIALGSQERGLVVDLHWKLTVSVSPQGLSFEPLFARVETVDLLGQQVACPSKSDVFLITCLEGTRDLWSSVARILDLAVQVDRTSHDEWSALLDAAKTAGCERRALVGVGHVCRVLGMETPQLVALGLEGDRGSRALLRRPLLQHLTGAPPAGLLGRLVRMRVHAGSEDRLLDRVRFVAARLLAPTTEDWQTFRLPPRGVWLYFPLRPARLVAKWFKRLLRIGQGGCRPL